MFELYALEKMLWIFFLHHWIFLHSMVTNTNHFQNEWVAVFIFDFHSISFHFISLFLKHLHTPNRTAIVKDYIRLFAKNAKFCFLMLIWMQCGWLVCFYSIINNVVNYSFIIVVEFFVCFGEQSKELHSMKNKPYDCHILRIHLIFDATKCGDDVCCVVIV